jgi:hypothetical protein
MMKKLFLVLFIISNANAATLIGVADDYKCITEYVYEDNGEKNRNVPEFLKNPTLSLTALRPEIAILIMNDSSKKYFLAKELINLTDLGKGISYETEKSKGTTQNFLDVFSSGVVIFGVKHEKGYGSTMKMDCPSIKKIDYLKSY